MDQEPGSLEARLAALERRVAELEGGKATSSPRVPALEPAPAIARTALAPRPDDWFRRGEGWLGRIGVALLAFGLLFLFRYAVERGWLSPATRIGLGVLAGGGFIFWGDRFFRERAAFRQILMGGGVALLLITTLAASLLYHMITPTQALVLFIVITGGALLRAGPRGDTVLASVAIAGALLPSAVLLQPQPSAAFWYFLLVMAGLGALAAARGGDAWFTLVAALATLIAEMLARPLPGMQPSELLALTGTWLGYAALPLLRGHLPGTGEVRHQREDQLRLLLPLVVSVALAVLAAARVLPAEYTLSIALGVPAVVSLGIAAWLLPRRNAENVGIGGFGAAACGAVVLGALATIAALPRDSTLAVPALFGAIAYFAAARLQTPSLRVTSYALFAGFAFWFMVAVPVMSREAAFDSLALSGGIGALLLAFVARRAQRQDERLLLWGGVFVAAHILMATELSAVNGASWLASAGYSVAGTTLVLVGLRTEQRRLQQAGLLSLALLVLRLFTFDTANAGTGVRIVLFAACGGAFLLLSYFFRARQPA